MSISLSKRYVTRMSRRPVRILCIDAEHEEFPVVGLIDGYPNTWTAEGIFNPESVDAARLDLIEVQT